MKPILASVLLLLGVVTQAESAVIILDDHQVWDTDTGVVLLSTALTAGLPPDNQYTQNGWYFIGDRNGPTTLSGDIPSALDVLYKDYAAPINEAPFNPEFVQRITALGAQTGLRVYGTFFDYTLQMNVCSPPTSGAEQYGYSCGFSRWFYYQDSSGDWRLQSETSEASFEIDWPAGTFWTNQRPVLYRIQVIPIPAAVLLFGSALGLVGVMRRRTFL